MNWQTIPGFGVAGNFAGHLEQAGESPDFVDVQTRESKAPKGIFPFYLPNGPVPALSINPYSHDSIQLFNDSERHQIEPEVSILFNVSYDNGQVRTLTPVQAMAHNDCSIRRPGAQKISEKKNWGPNSKGVATAGIPLANLDEGGRLDGYQLACYLIRDGQIHLYGVTSWVKDYSYFHQTLVTWLIEKMNHQVDHGPLENIHQYLGDMGYPAQVCISIGATRYTPFGESTFLAAGDTACVALYNPSDFSEQDIQQHLLHGTAELPNTSILKQRVVGPSV